MKRMWWLAWLLTFGTLPAWNQPADANVNSRYTVESVEVQGAREGRLSKALQEDLRRLVGEKFNQDHIRAIARRVRKELQARVVTQRLMKGTRPDHVKVVLHVFWREDWVDPIPSKFVYHSRQGWTVDTTANLRGFRLGLINDGDARIERVAGFRAGYVSDKIFTDRLRVGFLYEGSRAQWNRLSLLAIDERAGTVPGIYRVLHSFHPKFTVRITESLALTGGLRFQRFQTQFPAATTEAAHAAVGTLRYRQHWEDSGSSRQTLDAVYELRAATRSLSTDYVYSRHSWSLRHEFRRDRQAVVTRVEGGLVGGRAPLFERFVLGNADTLRGWNKFEVFPLGGTRAAHGSLEYRHRVGGETWVALFYDTGSAWDRGQPAQARHALGFGVRTAGGFRASIGFPIGKQNVVPMFTLGVNF